MTNKEIGNPAERPFYALPVCVRISDTDMFQHINNVSYLTFVEGARLEFFRDIGGDIRSELAITKSVQIDYLRPATLYDPLVALVRVNRVGNSSIELEVKIANAEDHSVVYATCQILQIHCCARTGQPCRVGDASREGLKRIGQID